MRSQRGRGAADQGQRQGPGPLRLRRQQRLLRLLQELLHRGGLRRAGGSMMPAVRTRPFLVQVDSPEPDKKGLSSAWSASGGETGIHFRLTRSRRRGRGHGAKLAAAALALSLAACLKAGPPASAATPPLARAPDGRSLAVTFDDEFDSFRRFHDGKGVWRTTYRDGQAADEFDIRTLKNNKEVELYVDPDFQHLGLDPFRIRDGMLEITADRPPEKARGALRGYQYVSGVITTQPSFSQTYGYFEMRAKLPAGKGVWPAFWLVRQDLSWPPEVDIMESIGDPSEYYATLHSNDAKDGGTKVPIDRDGFHVFAVSWDAQQLVWFVDGREVKRLPTPPDMHKPMYIIANLALGGDWAGYPDAGTPFPATLRIDYIRAYRFAQ
ncbi:MAG: glycoside hydrolase family 16 protein [Phenylobacterium sp.]|nr:MAG: glycoside hydrolase family 16 protein [Phenylobacterium sp.]